MRKGRLTANNSGNVINAKKVTLSLIKRLLEEYDISRVKAVLRGNKWKKGALKISEYFFAILQFHKISIPTTRVVFGLSTAIKKICSVKLNWKFEGGETGWQAQTKEPSSGRYGYCFGTKQCDIKQRCFLLRWFLRNKIYRWIFLKLSLNVLYQALFRKI